jgi:hypothetical protein
MGPTRLENKVYCAGEDRTISYIYSVVTTGLLAIDRHWSSELHQAVLLYGGKWC